MASVSHLFGDESAFAQARPSQPTLVKNDPDPSFARALAQEQIKARRVTVGLYDLIAHLEEEAHHASDEGQKLTLAEIARRVHEIADLY